VYEYSGIIGENKGITAKFALKTAHNRNFAPRFMGFGRKMTSALLIAINYTHCRGNAGQRTGEQGHYCGKIVQKTSELSPE